MSNDLTKISAQLNLSADFVKRVTALRSGRPLDGSALMLLLEAGLDAMEQMARSQDCDCVDCRLGRGDQPSPTLEAEFSGVLAQMRAAAAAAPAGVPDPQLTMALPEAALIFAAFLDRVIEGRIQGGLRLVGKPVDMNDPADRQAAIRYITEVVLRRLDMEAVEFQEGRHPALFPPQRGGKPRPTLH